MKRNLSYLANCPIAVLGAGAVGRTLAADCKLGQPNREVRLYSRSARSLAYMDRTGIQMDGIQRNLYAFERSGRAYLDMYTTDMAKAVGGAKLILLSVPALAHEDYLRKLVPLLEDGMVIHTFPDNYASFLLRRFMREAGCTKDVIIGGWDSAPYGTRVEKVQKFWTNHVGIKYRAISLRGACLPMTDIDDFIESANYLPCMDSVTKGDGPVKGDTMLDIGFSNVNPVIHVPASLLGVSSMENWSLVYGNAPDSYSMYSHGLCPSICRIQYQFYMEEVALAKAIGIDYPKYKYEMFFSRRSILTQEYMGLDKDGNDNVVFPLDKPCDEGNTGPNDINHRYITEDIPVSCKLYHDLGIRFNVPTPIIDAMIIIGGGFHEKSYFKETKYNLDYLGIGQLTNEQLHDYLYNGVYPKQAE